MLNSLEALTLSQPSLIDRFYSDLLQHPKCAHFSEEQKRMIFQAGKIAEDFHKHEKRNVSGGPYIAHPIALVNAMIDSKIIQGEKNRRKYPRYKSIIILLLHDTLESHPERFEEIYNFAGIEIFCRILKLSRLTSEYRGVIKDFLYEQLGSLEESEMERYESILYMLSDDIVRKRDFHIKEDQIDKERFEKFCHDYKVYLDASYPYLKEDKKKEKEKKEKEIDGLWHYKFFDEIDAMHKYYDTTNNIADMNAMSLVPKENEVLSEKQKYEIRRKPKLSALIYVLNKLKMSREKSELLQLWLSVGGKSHEILQIAEGKQGIIFKYQSLVGDQVIKLKVKARALIEHVR